MSWRYELDVIYKDGLRKTIKGHDRYTEWNEAYKRGHILAKKLINTLEVNVTVVKD